MKNYRTKLATLVLAGILASLLAACAQPFTESPAAAGTGTLKVSFSGDAEPAGNASAAASRTILPDLAASATSYELTLTSQSGAATRTATVSADKPFAAFADLEAGMWDIAAVAKKGSDTIATGKLANQTISAGAVLEATVPLAMNTASGSGDLSLAIEFPSSTGIDSLTCSLEDSNGAVAQAAESLTLSSTVDAVKASYAKTGLTSGSYSLVMNFKRGATSAGIFRESVNIASGLTADHWLDPGSTTLVDVRRFAASDFFDSNGSLSNLSLSGAPAGSFQFASSTISYDIGLIPDRSSINFTATDSGVAGQAIKYSWNGSTPTVVGSATASPNLSLIEGTNTLVVSVIKPDTSAGASYTITMKWVPVYTGSSGIAMVKVPAGTFLRDGVAGNPTYVSSFLMGQKEVGVDEFTRVTGLANPSSSFTAVSDGPLQYVSWYHALVFCNKLSLQEGLVPVYTISGSTDPAAWGAIPTISNATWNAVIANWSANGYRLPTEMEWMWAAIGADSSAPGQTNTTSYAKPFAGSNGSNSLGDYAWTSENSGDSTHTRGTKLPNELGIYDLSGNVWEWTWDWWTGSASYPLGPWSNYTGAASGAHRIPHGGCWLNDLTAAPPGVRGHNDPALQWNYVGFRVARNAQTLSVVYLPNGGAGTVPVDSNVYIPGNKAIAMQNSGNLSKDSAQFAGWNTASDGSGISFQPEDIIPALSGKTTLYATYAAPSLPNSWIKSGALTAGWKWTVAFGNGRFVAVSSTSTSTYYSVDGVNWTAGGSLPMGQNAVVFGKGKFVTVPFAAGGNQGAVSSDGLSWTATTIPVVASQSIYSLGYGNGLFVAVDSYNPGTGTNKVIYSSDGTNWQSGSGPAFGGWNQVVYGNGRFVTQERVANSTRHAVSSDGINWTANASPGLAIEASSGPYTCLGFVAGNFVALAAYGKNGHSVDGVNWTMNPTLAATDGGGWWMNGFYNCTGFLISYNGDYVFGTPGNRSYLAFTLGGTNISTVSWLNGSARPDSWFWNLAYGNGHWVGITQDYQGYPTTNQWTTDAKPGIWHSP